MPLYDGLAEEDQLRLDLFSDDQLKLDIEAALAAEADLIELLGHDPEEE